MKQKIGTSTVLKSIFHFWEDDLKTEQFIRKCHAREIFIPKTKNNHMLLIIIYFN